MNPILHALQRALIRRADVNVPPAVNIAPIPGSLFRGPIRIVIDQADTTAYALGPYAADPRIIAIAARRIRLDDGRTIDRIPEPPQFPHAGAYGTRPSVWRLTREDRTPSAFWWPDLTDALADILGPARQPVFIPGAALAALAPDSDLLPQGALTHEL